MEAITDNRERIGKMAKELFMQLGIRSVTMDDLAVRMGISKKTIYQFFKDKDELVMAMVEGQVQENQQRCKCTFEASANAVEEIFFSLDHLSEIFKTMNPAILFDLQKYHPAAYAKLQKHKNDYLFQLIKSNIERGISEGLYRSDLKAEILGRFRVLSLFVIFSPEFNDGLGYSLVESQEEILLNFLFGLLTSKGYELAMEYKTNREHKNKK